MWPDSQEIADLVTFNEEAYMENFIFFVCLWEIQVIYFTWKDPKKGNDARMILVGYPCEQPFINPSVPNTLFLYPLQIENRKVFCFQELGKGCIGNKWVNNTYLKSK